MKKRPLSMSSNWALSVMLQPSWAIKVEIFATIPRRDGQVTVRQNLVMGTPERDHAAQGALFSGPSQWPVNRQCHAAKAGVNHKDKRLAPQSAPNTPNLGMDDQKTNSVGMC
ncbi:hypothetical protein [Pseudotabrizicola sp. L79]|uniref:hypothetical protein n=1 Tax=Pseudotabrizicola sp. L79 TaxID=3118402 RepID=UPI002F930182